MNKIDLYNNSELLFTQSTMKPVYSTNIDLLCGVIEYNNKTYLVDLSDKDRIINFNKTFVFANEDDLYPSYAYNYKRFTYLDFIYSFNQESVHYIFKNENLHDLRRCNVEIYHFYHKNILEKYTVIDYINGHYLTLGQDANVMKNPIWKIKENDKEYLLMYCEKDTICKLCIESYQKILEYEINKNNGKKITWHKHQTGYISCSINLYIHQIIMGCYGNGKGTKNISVDHIDQNPLNNSFDNLRIATRKEQEQNTKGIKPGTKRERKTSAKDLPEGITQDMMKKYVVYYQEWLDTEHTKQREFFKVEKHPKLDKPWATTKSNNVSIQEKLAHANKVVDDLENDIYPNKDAPTLPKYVSLIVMREKPHLVFEKRNDGKRLNLKMILPDEYDLDEQVSLFKVKIREKYGASLVDNNVVFNFVYDAPINNDNRYIKKITFEIVRNYDKHTLIFETYKTEKEAILEVEKWLSIKITEEYFNSLQCKHDLNEDFAFYKNLDCNRGALLGSGIYLEVIETIGHNHVNLDCSS
jgi:hypothetical protein